MQTGNATAEAALGRPILQRSTYPSARATSITWQDGRSPVRKRGPGTVRQKSSPGDYRARVREVRVGKFRSLDFWSLPGSTRISPLWLADPLRVV